MKNNAFWIWYPGDFEIFLYEKVTSRRDFRGIIQLPFWKMETYNRKITFAKHYQSDCDIKVQIFSTGKFAIAINDTTHFIEENEDKTYTIPKGSGRLFVDVFSDIYLPALMIVGDELWTDSSWSASPCNEDAPLAASSDNFTSPDNPPTGFKLQLKLKNYISKRTEQASFKGKSIMGTLYDFGEETFGYIILSSIQNSGEVFIFYGECEEEALSPDYCETFDKAEFSTPYTQSFKVNHSRGFRYVFVVGNHCKCGDISYEYEYLPIEHRSTFQCSDNTLNKIYDISLHTLHLCTREFFLDGLKRDRWVWGGDVYQSCMMNYYSFFDHQVCRRSIYVLCPQVPIKKHINHIMDYTMYWFATLYDYILFTGDIDFAKEIYDRASALMEFCISRCDKDGFMHNYSDDWIFVDWADMEKEGALCVEQILFANALKTMSKIADISNHPLDKEKYLKRFDTLIQQINKVFYSKENNAFMHVLSDNNSVSQLTRYANIFAILYNITGQDKTKLCALLKNDTIAPVGTPYARLYELDALCECGEHEYVLGEMLDYWGGMLKEGATSFWEKYSSKDTNHYQMYDRPFGKSLCHAWGAGPVYLLGKHFLGIYPDSIGYESFIAKPNLSSLEFIKGCVPTNNGNVRLYMDRKTISIYAENVHGVLYFKSSSIPTCNKATVHFLDSSYHIEIKSNTQYKIYYSAFKKM